MFSYFNWGSALPKIKYIKSYWTVVYSTIRLYDLPFLFRLLKSKYLPTTITWYTWCIERIFLLCIVFHIISFIHMSLFLIVLVVVLLLVYIYNFFFYFPCFCTYLFIPLSPCYLICLHLYVFWLKDLKVISFTYIRLYVCACITFCVYVFRSNWDCLCLRCWCLFLLMRQLWHVAAVVAVVIVVTLNKVAN